MREYINSAVKKRVEQKIREGIPVRPSGEGFWEYWTDVRTVVLVDGKSQEHIYQDWHPIDCATDEECICGQPKPCLGRHPSCDVYPYEPPCNQCLYCGGRIKDLENIIKQLE